MQKPKNISPEEALRNKAKEETASIQKTQLAVKKRKIEESIKVLKRDLIRLGDEIRRGEVARTTLLAKEQTAIQQKKKAEDTLKKVADVQVRGKTEHQGVATKIETLKTQLALLIEKKEKLSASLAELAQKTTGSAVVVNKKSAQEKQELEDQLSVLEKDIDALTISIRADEERLKEEKATFAREKTELQQVKQKLGQATTSLQAEEQNKNLQEVEEKKRERTKKDTETLLGSVEREIQDITKKIETVGAQAKMHETALQKSSAEEDTAKRILSTVQGELLPDSHRLKSLEAELSAKKNEKAEKEAKIRAEEAELRTLK